MAVGVVGEDVVALDAPVDGRKGDVVAVERRTSFVVDRTIGGEVGLRRSFTALQSCYTALDGFDSSTDPFCTRFAVRSVSLRSWSYKARSALAFEVTWYPSSPCQHHSLAVFAQCLNCSTVSRRDESASCGTSSLITAVRRYSTTFHITWWCYLNVREWARLRTEFVSSVDALPPRGQASGHPRCIFCENQAQSLALQSGEDVKTP
jgi:hypothetical protein